MSCNYQVCAFSRLMLFDEANLAAAPTMPMPDYLTKIFPGRGRAVRVGSIMDMVSSPAKQEVLAWRSRLDRISRSQLGEALSWDEDSSVVLSEDALGGSELFAAAAALDQSGSLAASRLRGTSELSRAAMDEFSRQVQLRGFTSSFTQILLDVNSWLPFRRDLIIEEPDWRDRIGRFGSLPTLLDQTRALQEWIAVTEPAAKRPPDAGANEDLLTVLARAWRCADCVISLAGAAVVNHLPLHFSC